MGVLYAILAALGQGLGYTLLKKSNEDTPNSISFAFDTLFSVMLWIPYTLFSGINFQNLIHVLPYAFLSAIIAEAFVFYAFSKCQLSLGGTIFATYPIFTLIFSKLILKEDLSIIQITLITIILLGIFMITLPQRKIKNTLVKSATLLYPLLGSILVGLSDTVSKNSIDHTDAQTFLLALGVSQIPVAIGYLRIEKQSLKKVVNTMLNIKRNRYSLLSGLTISLSMIFFWKAYETTLTSIASPITASYVAFILILSLGFLKEKISKKDLIWSILTILSVIGLSFN